MCPIYCDSRKEDNIIRELNHRHLAIDVRLLESADYCFRDVGIERKTVSDLYSSAMSKRLWTQLDTLRKTYKIPILIIENFQSFRQLDKVTQGIITTLILFWKQQVIFSFDYLESSKWIEALFLKYGVGKSNREPPAAVKKQKTIKSIKLEALQCVKGIGVVKAKLILEKNPKIFSMKPYKLDLAVKGLNKRSKLLLENIIKGGVS